MELYHIKLIDGNGDLEAIYSRQKSPITKPSGDWSVDGLGWFYDDDRTNHWAKARFSFEAAIKIAASTRYDDVFIADLAGNVIIHKGLIGHRSADQQTNK